MKPLSSIVSLGAIALLVCGCSPSVKEESPAEVSQQREPKTSQATPRNTPPPFAGATQPGKSGKPGINQIAVAGLIPSTNPDRRRQEVERGRSDPFALIPVQPTFKEPQFKAPVPKRATAPKTLAPPKRPAFKPYSPMVPPPLPLPELAREVVVLGVIQIDGTPQIIVKAPNEQFTRYIQLGQFLANGQVRVKRIEGLGSPDPIVVLEELGQEVYRQVGEGVPQPAGAEGQATAFLPDLPQN